MNPPNKSIVRRRAVTLLEIVLATGLLVVLTSMTYWFYLSVLDSRQRDTIEAQRLRLIRAVLDRLSTEIRQASSMTSDGRVGIRGEAERIWLSTYRVPSREALREPVAFLDTLPKEYDFVKVEYKIARHPEFLHDDGYEAPLGLARVELAVPRADSAQTGEAFDDRGRTGTPRSSSSSAGTEGETAQERPDETGGNGSTPIEGNSADEAALDDEFFGPGGDHQDRRPETEIRWEELYASEIRYLRFCYYDGNKWWDDWDVEGENPLPQLVQVTVGFEPRVPFDFEFVPDEVREFCTCMNRAPQDCLPLPPDEYSIMVRVAQSDPMFRSRIARETQNLAEQLTGEPR